MLAALLADARPVSLHDRDVTVAFPAGKAFLKRKAEQDDYRRATAEALPVIGRRWSSVTSSVTRRSRPHPRLPASPTRSS